jgi:hypothetical protein
MRWTTPCSQPTESASAPLEVRSDERHRLGVGRTQPSLTIKKGRAETMTHDYKRHGTTDLLNVATGEITHALRERHAGADVLAAKLSSS